jgi:hypothetical protein
MKNQYFGDINDYRKYGLLRVISHVSGLRMLVAWMLTPDDGSSDGKFVSYLTQPEKWSFHDSPLFNGLRELLLGGQERSVGLMENADLLPRAEYYSAHVPDDVLSRSSWFSSLVQMAQGTDFIFFDPDNGLEVRSTPYGNKNSSKFLYWHEVDALWSAKKSLLIYQHFIRERRIAFIQRMLEALKGRTPASLVEAFVTPHVVFLLALQPAHQEFHSAIVRSVQEHWKRQIKPVSGDKGIMKDVNISR